MQYQIQEPGPIRKIMANLFYIIFFLVCFATVLAYGTDTSSPLESETCLQDQTQASDNLDNLIGP